jgi:hypothetical protein
MGFLERARYPAKIRVNPELFCLQRFTPLQLGEHGIGIEFNHPALSKDILRCCGPDKKVLES